MRETGLSEGAGLFSNFSLLVPYILPYVLYVGIASVFNWLGPEWNYLIRIAAVVIAICWAWRWYVPLSGPNNTFLSILTGVLFGLIGTFFWIVLLQPFLEPSQKAWGMFPFWLRLGASTLLVPIAEELLMRVYVFRIAHQWSIERQNHRTGAFEKVFYEKSLNDFKPGAWSYFAVIFSSVIFAMGHQVVEWPAAVVYGVLMSVIWILRKDIISCIVAHSTTNFVLGIYIFYTGSWELW